MIIVRPAVGLTDQPLTAGSDVLGPAKRIKKSPFSVSKITLLGDLATESHYAKLWVEVDFLKTSANKENNRGDIAQNANALKRGRFRRCRTPRP